LIPKKNPQRDYFYLLIKGFCQVKGLSPVYEYKFAEGRKFRFDIALVEHKIAIEYEGVMGAKSRHMTIGGYTKDCEKYNLATKQGWRVLRYTAINYADVQIDLQQILKHSF
jgi:very-short-patch-repair endonuclease